MKKAIGWLVIAQVLAWCSAPMSAYAQAVSSTGEPEQRVTSDGLADLSLEELMNVEVFSVSKKPQKLSESAAAIYVLTQEDIRRSGATSIMDALRLVPGVQVANLNRNIYSITVRGFNERFANKLLVLIDGRSVYTPLFAGVYWDVQDTVLEDVDRIEVIRGPGGTLWGANAVNGVINVITKSAADTQGTLVSALAGNEENGTYVARQGAKLGDDVNVRVYGKYFDRESYHGWTQDSGMDQWRNGRGGFRMDWDASERDAVTVQGEYYAGDSFSQTQAFLLVPPYLEPSIRQRNDIAGAHLLTRWSRDLKDRGQTELQLYYDRTDRRSLDFSEYRDTVDLEFQHNLRIGERHELIWGLNYRFLHDDTGATFEFTLDPGHRAHHLFTGFVQNELRLLDDALRLTLGTKIEHNDYTGVELQPSGRFLWKAAKEHTVWGAVSRAVRTPSRAEEDIRINAGVIPPDPMDPMSLPVLVALTGSKSFGSEELIAFELGYRTEVASALSIDIATFYNIYDDIRSAVIAGPPVVEADSAPLHVTQFYTSINGTSAETWGVEVAADLVVSEAWRLRGGYTYLNIDTDDPFVPIPNGIIDTGEDSSSPDHSFFVRSLAKLPFGIELDANLRYVDGLTTVSNNVPTKIDEYITADLRLAYSPIEGLELSVVGLNLFEDDHSEFGRSTFASGAPTDVERSVYGKITWQH
jgi:iron complex outermembrane receptor protein